MKGLQQVCARAYTKHASLVDFKGAIGPWGELLPVHSQLPKLIDDKGQGSRIEGGFPKPVIECTGLASAQKSSEYPYVDLIVHSVLIHSLMTTTSGTRLTDLSCEWVTTMAGAWPSVMPY